MLKIRPLSIAAASLLAGATAFAQESFTAGHGVLAPEPVTTQGPNVPPPPRVLLENLPDESTPPIPIGFGGNPQPNSPPVDVPAATPSLASTYVAFNNATVLPAGASQSRISEPACAFADTNNGFFTANWYAARTADGGANWAYENPYTKFAASFGGFCCDQRLLNKGALTVWMLQYVADGSGNGGTRLAVCNSAANLGTGTFSASYMFTPQLVGFAAGTWFDFPDCAASTDYFYFASNVFNGAGTFQGAVVWRVSQAQLSAGGTVNFSYINSNSIGGASYRLTQDAGTRMFWGRHESTTSLHMNWWDDSGNSIFAASKAVAAWSTSYGADPGPDGRDWTGRADSRILGAYQTLTDYGFLWHSGPIGSRTHNFIRLERFSLADNSQIEERDIWGSTFSLMYPAAAANAAGHIGISCALGGPSFYPGSVTILRDDLEDFSSARFFTSSNAGPTSNVWGDYFTVQGAPHFTEEMTWFATGMGMIGGGANGNQQPHFVRFGRDAFSLTNTGVIVKSSGASGVPITMTPGDRFGESNGNTPFYRSYVNSTANVSVTAPATTGSLLFKQWTLKTVPHLTAPNLFGTVGQLTYVDSNIGVQTDTLEAVYVPARTLTVQSAPTTGVNITASPADFNGTGNGNTNFALTYRDAESTTLTAPANVGFNPFKYWVLDGVPQAAGVLTLLVTMDANHTALAQYWTNVPGTYSTFGSTCINSLGTFPLHTVLWNPGQQGPQQGLPLTYRLINGRPLAVGVLMFGLSNTNWPPYALPLSLNFIGVTGCTLYHDIIVTEATGISAAGVAAYGFTWPADPGTLGVPIYTSYTFADPGVSRLLPLTFSNPAVVRLGGNQ